jgi:outer membrane lipoprotein carrier protein
MALSRRVLHVLALVGVVLPGTPAVGEPCGSAAACLQVIEEARRDTRTVTAHFEQVKHLRLLEEPLVSRGRFAFKRPDRALWRIDDPERIEVLVRGNEVYLPARSGGSHRALVEGPAGTMFGHIGAVLTGSLDLLKRSFEATARDDGETIEITLVPRRQSWKQTFRKIRVRFTRPFALVHEVKIEDGFGDHLVFTFDDVRRNVELSDAMFEPGELRRLGE